MAREGPKRRTYNEPGHAHALTFSVYRRRKLMFAAGVVEFFLENLLRSSERLRFDIWAYVVMPDHLHLLVWPREEVYKMESIRSAIKKPVTDHVFALYPEWRQTMTDRRPSRGNVSRFWQQGGGYDRNLFSPQAIQAEIEYIHNNPVRAGLAEKPTDYPWSSARNYAGNAGEIPVQIFSWLS